MPRGGDIVIETSCPSAVTPKPAESSGPPAGIYVRFSVKDTGCGMDAAVQAKIFEPFFTTKALGRGTGLGLSTAYGIVKQSDGYIQVKSEPGKGSVFNVFLPATRETPLEIKNGPPAAGVRAAGRGRVLLVEDDESMRGIAGRILSGAGYSVETAANGRQALKLLSAAGAKLPVFMLTDLIMPEMDGIELIKEVLVRYPGMRILCMSGYSSKEEELKEIIGSKAAYVQKPFEPDALLKKIEEILA
jgi:CheY-like chemotaxis protein